MAFQSFPVESSKPCTTQPCPSKTCTTQPCSSKTCTTQPCSSKPCTTQPCSCQPSPETRPCLAPYRAWKSDLLDCCVDKQICICGAFSPCVLACQVASGLGECFFLPLLPGAMVAARTALREQRRIQGDVCTDWLAACCCCPCAVCQMAREMQNPC